MRKIFLATAISLLLVSNCYAGSYSSSRSFSSSSSSRSYSSPSRSYSSPSYSPKSVSPSASPKSYSSPTYSAPKSVSPSPSAKSYSSPTYSIKPPASSNYRGETPYYSQGGSARDYSSPRVVEHHYYGSGYGGGFAQSPWFWMWFMSSNNHPQTTVIAPSSTGAPYTGTSGNYAVETSTSGPGFWSMLFNGLVGLLTIAIIITGIYLLVKWIRNRL